MDNERGERLWLARSPTLCWRPVLGVQNKRLPGVFLPSTANQQTNEFPPCRSSHQYPTGRHIYLYASGIQGFFPSTYCLILSPISQTDPLLFIGYLLRTTFDIKSFSYFKSFCERGEGNGERVERIIYSFSSWNHLQIFVGPSWIKRPQILASVLPTPY